MEDYCAQHTETGKAYQKDLRIGKNGSGQTKQAKYYYKSASDLLLGVAFYCNGDIFKN
jgi:hypothetical protein